MALPIVRDKYDAGCNNENDKLFIKVICSLIVLLAFVFSTAYSLAFKSRKKNNH